MLTLLRIGRMLSLVCLAVLGTCVLTYKAPGYFSDARELDAAHADIARSEMGQLRSQQSSLGALLSTELHDWLHGTLGRSRQYDLPVLQLVRERAATSASLLFSSLALSWFLALLLALAFSLHRSAGIDFTLAALTASCLAVPVGALATFSLVANIGSPVLVLSLVLAVRDFRFLLRLGRNAWQAPYVLHAQAHGLSPLHVARGHLAPCLRRELLSVAMLSFVTALSAIVPVEVVFDRPGLGQLAWSAAMNRDLPVLVTVTAIMAACIGLATCFIEPERTMEDSTCVSSC